MTVTSVDTDTDALSLTLIADFDAPVERVWELWADPRQLERWWGPPTHPATVEEHDLNPGGKVTYFMTSPEGERYRGYWDVSSVDAPSGLDAVDGFANADGTPADLPTTDMQVRLTAREGGTRVEIRSTFGSAEQMQQVLDMGAAEGITQAVGQIDALLAEG